MCSPTTQVFYSDLPLNLLLAARYLSLVFPGEVALVWTRDDAVDPWARINIIAPWRLDSQPSGIDLFANFLSCRRMRAENHAYCADILARKGVQSIFHMNREKAAASGEIDLDAYP